MSLLCTLLAAALPLPAEAQQPPMAQGAAVVVNGRPAALPGVPPGRYWYDARSGLWGYVGGPSQGFFTPGLDLGPLDPNASGGGTAVVLNGRILPPADLQTLTGVFGPIAPGRYWLDAVGNVGAEGGPATANLHAALAASGGAGPGSSPGMVTPDVPMHMPTNDIDIGGGMYEMPTGDIYSQ